MIAIRMCVQCDIPFEYEQKGCHPRYLCNSCREANRKELVKKNNSSAQTREAKARWANSPHGKEIRRKSATSLERKAAKKRYRQSPEGKEVEKRYWRSTKFLETRRRFLQSDKGKANLARTRLIWRNGSDYAEYLLFKNEAFRDKVPCTKCGKPWIDGIRGVTHEIDHIVPRKLGGTHKKENLQVLCFECHLVKTSEDRGKDDKR